MNKQELRSVQNLRKSVHRNYKTKREFDSAFDKGFDKAGKPMSPWLFFGILALGALIIIILAEQ